MVPDVVLLHAAQEAFANIRKYTQASAVTIELSKDDTNDRLSVANNYIALAAEHTKGFGLRGVQARVTQVNRTLSVTPSLRGGTTVQVEVPT
jgi:signal transduction histidine kinase